MLLRICLIIAMVGGLAVAAVNFVMVKEVITTTIKERDDHIAAEKSAQKESGRHSDQAHQHPEHAEPPQPGLEPDQGRFAEAKNTISGTANHQ